MTQVVERCQYGIDFHTGSDHRTNLPQLRVDLTDAEVERLAKAFAAPVTVDAAYRDGSLRSACRAIGIPLNMFTVMFSIGRVPGWIAHWYELYRESDKRIARPRQIYTGPAKRAYIPAQDRN